MLCAVRRTTAIRLRRATQLCIALLLAGCGGRSAVLDAAADLFRSTSPDYTIPDLAPVPDRAPRDARRPDRSPDHYVTPPPTWAVSAGGAGTDAVEAMALDPAGNLYITGYFSGSAKFGATTLTASGSSDLFLAKIAPSGTFAWAVSGHGTGFNRGTTLAVAPGGDVIVAGELNGAISLGATTLVAKGGGDAFVARFDGSGVPKWAASAGGMGWDYATAVAVDAAGVYVTGAFFDVASFGGHSASAPGTQSFFVARMSHAGAFQSVVAGVPTVWAATTALAVDSTGNLRLAGRFSDTLKLGSKTLVSAGNEDIFVASLQPDGQCLWAISAGGAHHDTVQGLALDAAGNAYLTGAHQGPATFGAHSLTTLNPSSPLPPDRAYLAKASPAGAFDWAVTALSPTDIVGTGSAVALAASDPIVVGRTELMLSSVTTTTVFLRRASPAGAILSTATLTKAVVKPRAIAFDGQHAYIAADFMLGANLSGVALTSAGDSDVCVWKLPLP